MFEKSRFQREVELLETKRQCGLQLIVKARPEQRLDEVKSVLEAISPRFEVQPLFPDDDFPSDPEGIWAWGAQFFVGILPGVSFDDVTANPWDFAHSLRAAGDFLHVSPEIQRERAGEDVTDDAVPAGAENWAHEAMRIEKAWAACRASAPGLGVHIAHIDTGYLDHEIWKHGNLAEDLQRNFVYHEDPENAKDRPGGYQGHGLRTSSVMAAPKVAGARLVGVAYNAKVVPLRAVTTVILDPATTSVARAVRWAVQKKYGVISMSLGGAPNLALHLAIAAALDADRILVAASGQGLGTSLPGWVTMFPAILNEVFGVAGSEQGDKEWIDSSWFPAGPRSVHASAPAKNVPIADTDNGYGTSSGTSYATAYVAGIAAMWLSHHFKDGYKGWNKATWCFRDHAHKTARRPSGFGNGRWGIIDAEKLITTSPEKRMSLSTEDEVVLKRSRTSTGFLEQFLSALLKTDSTNGGEKLVSDLLGGERTDNEPQEGEIEMFAEEVFALLTEHQLSDDIWSSSFKDKQALCHTLRSELLPVASDHLRQRLQGTN